MTSGPVDPSTSSFTFQIAPGDAFEGFERGEYPRPKAWYANVILTLLGFGLAVRGVAGLVLMDVRGLRWSNIWDIVLGVAAIGLLMIRPLVRVLQARRRDRQPLTVRFDQNGARATLDGHETRMHPWSKLERVQTGYRGVLLDFGDRATYWIPRHAFASRLEREAFIQFAQQLLPQQPTLPPAPNGD